MERARGGVPEQIARRRRESDAFVILRLFEWALGIDAEPGAPRGLAGNPHPASSTQGVGAGHPSLNHRRQAGAVPIQALRFHGMRMRRRGLTIQVMDPPILSSRTDWDVTPNPIARRHAQLLATGTSILDLTESNPTRCGFDYPRIRSECFAPAFLYAPDPRGLPESRRAIARHI
jgi:hypothetical protein